MSGSKRDEEDDEELRTLEPAVHLDEATLAKVAKVYPEAASMLDRLLQGGPLPRGPSQAASTVPGDYPPSSSKSN